MSKITNRQAINYINNLKPFRTGNETVFAKWTTAGDGEKVYSVYSYGHHFPMWVQYRGVWFGNRDKYSVTTSRHQSATMPAPHDSIRWTDTEDLKRIIQNGVIEAIRASIFGQDRAA
jgi:hypothetical protein